MQITFWGAAQEVTGSMHLLEVNNRRILLDCGLFQGHRAETYERNLHFPFDPATIDTLILSHAHIDHSGNIPNLVKQGFKGNIWCTSATRNLCTYMLMDSGHIQEQDVEYLNKQKQRKGEAPVEPIYTQRDAQICLNQFVSISPHRPVLVTDGVELTFHNAGHILGAAFVQVDIREQSNGKSLRLVFSGDLGREETTILNPPETLAAADIVLMESTYGDRLHDDYSFAQKKLGEVVSRTARRRGKVIIPAFAVGRTQELVYALNELDAHGDIPPIPVYVDSPLAVNATDDLLPLAGGSTSVLPDPAANIGVNADCDLMRLNSPNSEMWNRGGGYDWHFHAIPNGRKNIHFSGHGFIAGTVKEKGQPDQPLVRRVQLVSENARVLVAETWSDATGAYLFELIDPSQRYTVVSYDYKQMYRAVIADNLRPEMMP